LQATASARERPALLTVGRGQQIWFKSKADGHSPDERERDAIGCAVGACAPLAGRRLVRPDSGNT